MSALAQAALSIFVCAAVLLALLAGVLVVGMLTAYKIGRLDGMDLNWKMADQYVAEMLDREVDDGETEQQA